jgi:hypothetical protein
LSPIYPRSPRQLLTQEMASPNEARRALLLACINEALGIVEDIKHNKKWDFSMLGAHHHGKTKNAINFVLPAHPSLPTCVPTTTGAHLHGLDIWTLFKTSLISCWTCKQLKSLPCITPMASMPTAELLSLSPFGLLPPVCCLLLLFGSTAQLEIP